MTLILKNYQTANNFYDWVISKVLPHLGFKWIDVTSSFDIINIPEDSELGYILKVDFNYPLVKLDSYNDSRICVK